MVQLCPHGEAISDECYPTPDSVECCGGEHVKVGKNPFAFEKNAGQPEASYDKTVNICIKAWL